MENKANTFNNFFANVGIELSEHLTTYWIQILTGRNNLFTYTPPIMKR